MYREDPAKPYEFSDHTGRDILVAPVTQQGASSRTIYLPQGAWYDFWTGKRLEGNTTITREVDLATMPLYVRAGAVIPWGPVKQYVNEDSKEPMTLSVYPGVSETSMLYMDDGQSFAYEHGDCLRLLMHWNENIQTLTLEPTPGFKQVWSGLETVLVTLNSGPSKQVSLKGSRTTVQF